MKIENDRVYHLPTQAHEDDFLKKAHSLGIRWSSGKDTLTTKNWDRNEEEYCISVENNLLTYGGVNLYELLGFKPIEWELTESSTPEEVPVDNGEIKLETLKLQAELFRKLMVEVHSYLKYQETLPDFVADNDAERHIVMGTMLDTFISDNDIEV